MRTLTVQLSESAYQVLAKDAKSRLMKPEELAQAAIEDHVRLAVLLDRRFRDAAHEVDRRLAHASA
jgi:hypothetical protein